MKTFKLPFRVGRKQNRAVLDADGFQVVVFDKGREQMAQQYCELINKQPLIPNTYKEGFQDGEKYITSLFDKEDEKYLGHCKLIRFKHDCSIYKNTSGGCENCFHFIK